MVMAWGAEVPTKLVAVTLKVVVPLAGGVPLMRPLLGLSVSHAGYSLAQRCREPVQQDHHAQDGGHRRQPELGGHEIAPAVQRVDLDCAEAGRGLWIAREDHDDGDPDVEQDAGAGRDGDSAVRSRNCFCREVAQNAAIESIGGSAPVQLNQSVRIETDLRPSIVTGMPTAIPSLLPVPISTVYWKLLGEAPCTCATTFG